MHNLFYHYLLQLILQAYTTGNSIEISGTIKDLAQYEQPVVLMIVSPDWKYCNYTTSYA